jgi:hypothetical protein
VKLAWPSRPGDLDGGAAEAEPAEADVAVQQVAGAEEVGDRGAGGPLEQRLGGVVLDDGAVQQQRDPLAELGRVGLVVGDE